MLVAMLALAVVGAPPGQAAAPAKPVVVSVRVEAAAFAPASVRPAVDELRVAIEARKEEFRAPKPGEKPNLVVRVDAVRPTADGKTGLAGALVKGDAVRPFDMAYPGDLKALAAALARNLRDLANEIKPAPAAAK